MNEERKQYASAESLQEDIVALCSVPSLSGFEYRGAERVREIYGKDFDEIMTDAVGSHVLIKRCGREGAPKILVDAHFDEVGLIVTDILEGGFLRMLNLGGIDPAIMQAADVVVYGKETLRGVVISTPPHLRSGNDGKLTPIDALLIDVGLGYTKEELSELVPVGTPVGFSPVYSVMNRKFMAGKAFDDKACGAIAARAIIDTPREELAGDVYLTLSAREETARPSGAHCATFKIEPDYAFVIDVELGKAPDVAGGRCPKLGGGMSVAFSAATDRELTRMTAELLEEKGVAFVRHASPSSTGTNSTTVNLVLGGVPTVDIGLPLRNMHTYNEVLNLDDCNALCGAVREFICSKKIAERFAEVQR